VRDLCLLSSAPTGAPLFPGVLVTHLVTSAVARSLLPRGLVNVQRSWSPPIAELHRQPPGVPYEDLNEDLHRAGLLGTLAQETPTDLLRSHNTFVYRNWRAWSAVKGESRKWLWRGG
jgi:hypothetical protein